MSRRNRHGHLQLIGRNVGDVHNDECALITVFAQKDALVVEMPCAPVKHGVLSRHFRPKG